MRWEEEDVKIPVEGRWLEARVCAQQSPVVVIALHPWGPLGGCMDDPHVQAVCRTFGKAGCSTVRFDFRSGIGSGSSSVRDVVAVASRFVEPQERDGPLATQVLIVGYSYGSMIGAAAAAVIPQCVGFAVLAPPLDYGWALYLLNGSALRARAAESAGRPKLLMVGSEDQFCSEASFQAFAEELPEPKKVVVLPGRDHMSLYQVIGRSLSEWIPEAFGVADLQAFAREGASQLPRAAAAAAA